ncbi:histidine kinase [Streptomyces venezuelae]|uniref:histidine kinase n=1 Tax=Streptomyces venezuelae TaxID=54571 RepID=A0A5P2CRR4_STRVZ|nr:histidine kinase [Streptomyces venezuelae]QES43781.1 histidine kinase [Streptomyces venezuelae]
MERIRHWLLPVLLTALQLAYWPGRALREDDPAVGAVQSAAALAAAAALTAGLAVRRRRPVAAALTVEAVLLACLPLPQDATLVHALGVLIALYSVAVRCPGRTVAVVGPVLALCEAGRSVLVLDSGTEAAGEAVVNCVLFLTVVGLGRSRRRWLAGRRSAARELARAESERARAALTERERLARELHDVSAHHLTSVVVTADAALRLGDRKPELTAQALEFAADTGRETTAALHRLVALMRTSAADEESPLGERVAELSAGFARLGLRPGVHVAPEAAPLTGPTAEAAFAIVREALTNALRYAPGSTVRIHVLSKAADGTVDVTVEDDGAAGGVPGGVPAARQRLGGGRGTVGMRERATALGGTFTAGPRTDGAGWAVHAHLPGATRAQRQRAVGHRALRGLDLSDGAVALAVATLPVFAVVVEEPTAAALACGPAVAHALPLLWRRRAPWAVLCAVLATAWLAPLGLAFGLLSPDVALCLATAGAVAECVAVYAVGAFAGPARGTWPVMAVAAAGLCLSFLALAVADGMTQLEEDGGVGLLLFLNVIVGAAFLPPMAAFWGLGAAVRSRRERVRAWEDHALTATVWSAVAEAHEERRRIAVELRGQVLRHADAVVARAEAGDLSGVAAEARAGLAAMRELLAALREVTAPGDTEAARAATTERKTSPQGALT